MHMLKTDILIIGSGLAGLTLAMKLADQRHVTIVTKRSLPDGSSNWAQGASRRQGFDSKMQCFQVLDKVDITQ